MIQFTPRKIVHRTPSVNPTRKDTRLTGINVGHAAAAEVGEHESEFVVAPIARIQQVGEQLRAANPPPDTQIDQGAARHRNSVVIVEKGAPRAPHRGKCFELPGQRRRRPGRQVMARDILQLQAGAVSRRDVTQRVRRDRADASGDRSLDLGFDPDVAAAPDVGVRERARVEIDFVLDVHPICQGAPPHPAAAGDAGSRHSTRVCAVSDGFEIVNEPPLEVGIGTRIEHLIQRRRLEGTRELRECRGAGQPGGLHDDTDARRPGLRWLNAGSVRNRCRQCDPIAARRTGAPPRPASTTSMRMRRRARASRRRCSSRRRWPRRRSR